MSWSIRIGDLQAQTTLVEKYMAHRSKEGLKTGPRPERLKIEDDWGKAMKKAVKKRRPKQGWPKENEPVDK